jgi:hypothetical protein
MLSNKICFTYYGKNVRVRVRYMSLSEQGHVKKWNVRRVSVSGTRANMQCPCPGHVKK